jgi:hypothetical protein
MGERELAERVEQSFQKAFWISPFRGWPTSSTRWQGGAGNRDSAIRPTRSSPPACPTAR